MDNLKKAKTFVNTYKKPFNTCILADYLDISIKEAVELINSLLNSRTIRTVNGGDTKDTFYYKTIDESPKNNKFGVTNREYDRDPLELL